MSLQTKIMIPSDSWEVGREYYLDKIVTLEKKLSQLTLLEHPNEIISICSKIIEIKDILRKMRNS